MRNVRCHASDGRTHGRTVESSAVFCLSRIRNNCFGEVGGADQSGHKGGGKMIEIN